MVLLLILIVCYSSLSDAVYDYQTVKIANDKSMSGQLIGEYEERWFWESAEGVNKYVGVFSLKNMSPKIHFVKEGNVVKSKMESRETSIYNNFLKDRGLFLKQAPFKGWNYISTGNEGHHLFENMFGNFAWDVTKLHQGKMFKEKGSKNQDYYVWSEPVYSPVKGTVIEIVRNVVDNSPDPTNSSDLSKKGDGNYVLIHGSDLFYFSFIHFKKGSIPKNLVVGSSVDVGDFIGNVGNSGVSYTPHLHMTMLYWSLELKRMVSVPTFINNIELISSPTAGSVVVDQSSPRSGQFIRTASF